MAEKILSIVADMDNIKDLKDKIVPADWSVNDETNPAFVKNRTHYTEIGIIELLPETALVDGVTEDSVTAFELETEISLIVGDTYIVKWLNVDYETVCVSFDGVPTLGNVSILGMGGDDTGEPFLIGAMDLLYIYTTETITEGTISIKGYNELIHRIDSKYMPEGYPWTEPEKVVLPEIALINGTVNDAGYVEFVLDPSLCTLSADTKYAVTLNGVEYTLVSVADGPVITLGDYDRVSTPFSLFQLPSIGIIVRVNGSATEGTLSIKISEVIHKLDKKYLPPLPDEVTKNVPLAFNYSCSIADPPPANLQKGITSNLFDDLHDGQIIEVTTSVTGTSTNGGFTYLGAGTHTAQAKLIFIPNGRNGAVFNLEEDLNLPLVTSDETHDYKEEYWLETIIIYEDTVILDFRNHSYAGSVLSDRIMDLEISITSPELLSKTAKPSVDLWSSTEGSTKRFRLTIDDNGTLTVKEVV